MKRILPVITIITLITIAFCTICRTFDTPFAECTIDWFSFLVGIFLISEAIYKIRKSKPPLLSGQFTRIIRIMIGFFIFSIHLIQYIWGINCKILDSPITQSVIDWTAFSAGIFLMAEGLLKISLSRTDSFLNQFLRMLRVLIGTCVFTIHLLQFMRF